LGKYDEALNFFSQSLGISREIGYQEGEWASFDYMLIAINYLRFENLINQL
jgi:hypothetical protein